MKQTNPAMPQLDEHLCTLCGLCVEACPCHAIELGEKGPVFNCPQGCVDGSACTGDAGCCLYLCEDVCPTGAISCGFEIVMETDEGNSTLASS